MRVLIPCPQPRPVTLLRLTGAGFAEGLARLAHVKIPRQKVTVDAVRGGAYPPLLHPRRPTTRLPAESHALATLTRSRTRHVGVGLVKRVPLRASSKRLEQPLAAAATAAIDLARDRLQVGRVHASPMRTGNTTGALRCPVAHMVDRHASGDRPDCHLVRHPMRRHMETRSLYAVPYGAVAIDAQRARPRPAGVRPLALIHLRPKAFGQRLRHNAILPGVCVTMRTVI